MGRAPCCDENGLKKGSWTPEEDQKLVDYIQKHGHGSWRALPKQAGLMRCGKSCRLRWTNYLRPDIKRGKFSFEEEQTILQLHAILGNKWSAIAAHLPGRTDNEIKNYWNTHLKKRLLQMGIDPTTHRPRTDLVFAAAANSRMSPFLAASSLSRMAPWIENAAKLEAEARLVRYYSKLAAAYRSSTELSAEALMNAENIINADLNLLSNSCRSSSQFDDHDANSAAPPHVWAPGHPAGLNNAAFDYNALFTPQALENIQNEFNLQYVQGASNCSETTATNNNNNNNSGNNYINPSQFVDNMRSVALGKLCSTPLMQMDRLFTNSDDHDLPMSNFKFGQRSDQSIPLSDSCITDDHNKSINTMPALISPRNIFSDPGDNIGPETNPNSCYGGALPPELLLELNAETSNLAKQNIAISSAISTPTVTPALWSDLNSEDCKDYWSNVLNQTACSWGS